MHLLVLSAFRLSEKFGFTFEEDTVSMHLLVLSAFRHGTTRTTPLDCQGLNAPFGAQCFPTGSVAGSRLPHAVSMHLLVLSAFRRSMKSHLPCRFRVSMHLLVLSAFRRPTTTPTASESGMSQCTFWCSVLSDLDHADGYVWQAVLSQCTFWCSVLSDRRRSSQTHPRQGSQCTFWCSVLSDLRAAPSSVGVSWVSMHLLVLSAFRPP